MSYACFDIVYGVPLVDESYVLLEKWDEKDGDYFEDNEGMAFGFVSRYGSDSRYLGVVLDGFDECQEFIKLTDVMLKPTDKQIAEFEDKLAKLPKKT